jgi:hypothetical protein
MTEADGMDSWTAERDAASLGLINTLKGYPIVDPPVVLTTDHLNYFRLALVSEAGKHVGSDHFKDHAVIYAIISRAVFDVLHEIMRGNL